MITNKQELDAALKWIEYWNSNRDTHHSWMGNEQAAQQVMRIRKDIDAYRRGLASGTAPSVVEENSARE